MKDRLVELQLLDWANSLVWEWPDDKRHAIVKGHTAEIAALVRLMYRAARVDVSDELAEKIKLLDPKVVEKAMQVIAEVLFCLGRGE